jgi:hypothetical protein
MVVGRGSMSSCAATHVFAYSAGNAFCHPKARGQNRITRTIAQTIPQPIHVMLG